MRDKSNLRVIYNYDFVNYYKWFIEQHFHILIHSPAHGAHSTIINATHHKNAPNDLLNKWHKTKVLVSYDPYIHVGGGSKTFRNFYLKVRSNVLDEVADDFGISSRGFHITVANTKGEVGTRPNFGKMIEIKVK